MSPSLPVIEESEPCDCPACRSMCRRPCWPIPSEVRALIDAGYGNRLMLDYWVGDFSGEYLRDNTYIICPANPGHEGSTAPDYGFSLFLSPLHTGCVFQKSGLCELHERKLKPAEGRAAHHAVYQPELHKDVARHWDTDEGRAVVALWCVSVGEANPYEVD